MFCQPLRTASLILAGLLLGAGCDTTITPVAEDNGLYSVYGTLTLTGDTDFIRVRPLTDPVLDDAVQPIDATVTLENLATGKTETLEDSVVVFQGEPTFNFRVTQAVQPATQYRLTVERSDGRATRATTTTPPFTDVDVEPGGPVDCTEAAVLSFSNVPEPRLLEVAVAFRWLGRSAQIQLDRPVVGDRGTPVISFDASTLVQRVAPQRILDTTGGPDRYCTLLDLPEIEVRYTHYGPDWPTDSLRADPTASSVDNGVGVLGALHRDTLIQRVNVQR